MVVRLYRLCGHTGRDPGPRRRLADTRYWTQAEAELAGTGIELQKIPTGAATHFIDWIAAQLKAGQTLAVDGQVLGLALAQQLRNAMNLAGISLRTDTDLIAAVWEGRPGLPSAPVYEHLPPQATVSRADKLAHVRAAVAAQGQTHHFISSVDDVAWLFNLRGADVDYNPVFVAHALLSASEATIFLAEGKVPAELQAQLLAMASSWPPTPPPLPPWPRCPTAHAC